MELKDIKLLDKQELFDDYYQVMSERGATFEILHDAGISANDAVIGTPDEGVDMEYNYIPPLMVNKKTQKALIKKRGGIDAMLEFMAYNADWEKYQEFYDEGGENY